MDFVLDITKPSGPSFHLKYDGGFFFNLYNNDADVLRPPGIDTNTKVYVTDYDPPKPATGMAIPFDETDVYTIQFPTDGSIHQFPRSSLVDYDATQIPENSPPTPPSWFYNKCPITLFLNTMNRPNQGRLKQQPDDT